MLIGDGYLWLNFLADVWLSFEHIWPGGFFVNAIKRSCSKACCSKEMGMRTICNSVFRRVFSSLLFLAMGFYANSAYPSGDEWDYVMRRGDTLIGIAERYFSNPQSWPLVQSRNHIADPYRIPTDTRLKIPARLLRTDPVAAEVLMVNGQASRVAVSGADTLLSAGALLQSGDSVRVAAGSNLSLRFPDGTRLLVLENSRFTLSRAVRLGRTDMLRIQIDLAEGNVESNVTPAPGGANQYEIRTPALRMAVRGTRFRAAADPSSGLARSEVLGGRVQVSGDRKTVMLGEGFGSFAAPGKPPEAPLRLAGAPELSSLSALYERVPLRFTWKPVPTVQGYRAQVLDSSANMVLDGVFQDNAARWADLPDGRYTLRVRSIGENRLEGRDAEHAFTLKARPEPPFVRRPTNRAYGESTQFDWTEGAGIASYHFQLASDDGFAQLLADESAVAATSRITRSLVPGHYFWRVASIDARGDHGPFGDVIAFEQRPVPASPQPEAPEIDDDQLHFRWRAGDPGQRYLLQLAKTPDFAELLLEQTTDVAQVVVPRPAAGDYFMRVKAIEADGFSGPFGAPQRFTVPGTSGWWLLLLLLPVVL
jgi:hypothetical protein